MTRTQHIIHPILEEGIDRKVLSALRARFLAVNSARLARAAQAMSTRQQQVLKLLPLLFHVNHPILPGYVSATTPAGLANYEPDADQLAEVQRLSRSFIYKPLRGKAPQPILGLYLMGSLGTVAQDEHSDLDVWVCHDPELDARQIAELRRKCDALRSWAATQGSEAHFFLVDPQRFTQGQREAKLTSDDCGTTQHYLLLDEFYRTALWLGGCTPLWWLVPDYEEHRYDEYVATLLAKRFVRADEVLDLGHLGQIPPGEFVGAGLWQLYKAIDSPYKSLFKLLLVEVYASRHPQLRCLALDFKQAVYQGRIELEQLDPYIAAYRAIEHYLGERGERERLELARRCLYLKINRPLSRPPLNRNKSWQRTVLEGLTRDWQWDERQFNLLDNRSRWKVRQVSQERRALVNELTYGYRFLSDFTRRLQAASPLTSRDLGVLGRRLYAAIERKAGKVEFVNLGISPDMSEDSLTLVHDYDAAGDARWTLYQGQLTVLELAHFAPLKRFRELVALLAWGHRNGVIDAGTQLSLFPGDSGLSEAELFSLLSDLRRVLPLPLAPVGEEALLAASRPSRVLLLVNIGLDPTLLTPEQPASAEQATRNATPENLVLSVDQITLNSWNELLVTRYEGPQALPQCLRDYLSHSWSAAEPPLQVFCFARNRGQAIARRMEQIFHDAYHSLAGSPRARHLLQIRQHFHVLQRADDTLRLTSLNDREALLEHLAEAHHAFSPLLLDSRALAGDELALILAQGRPGCLQVFYRKTGETAALSVLDECNALWHQTLPYRDERTLLKPLMRFLESVFYRRRAQQPSPVPEAADPEVLIYRIRPGNDTQPLQLERRPVPQGEVSDPFYDVQAIVEAGESGRSQVTLYCNQQEFSGLEYGADLFAAVARTIISHRRDGERYPCYITDLDLSGLHGTGRSQTVQYLRYKSRLEAALNSAIRY
ncbi:class I adenylate cyclase [Stutzerimonas stutzeri]|uniref:Adenylate cyclase n=1 Tax=Stutzerimonas stutzeri KOS6 TaxID=1218352 RepID=A0A061JTP3_STUST|nr:class I adenylate cyclase [Stutzerimonas stutzeri]EWC43121.1 adenylate cyclase [Stutzerimonas stutzeri KOS6]